MKQARSILLTGLLAVIAGAASASSASLSPFTPKYIPVLVHVNAQGKVTEASAAIDLSPPLRRLLYANLSEMITKPATYRRRAVASQFVANMSLRTTPAAEGRYNAQFIIESMSPVPSGTWHWANIDGRRLVLVDSSGSLRELPPSRVNRGPYPGSYNAPSTMAPLRPAQSTMQNAPATSRPATPKGDR